MCLLGGEVSANSVAIDRLRTRIGICIRSPRRRLRGRLILGPGLRNGDPYSYGPEYPKLISLYI
jgi:hypothetical protein